MSTILGVLGMTVLRWELKTSVVWFVGDACTFRWMNTLAFEIGVLVTCCYDSIARSCGGGSRMRVREIAVAWCKSRPRNPSGLRRCKSHPLTSGST